MKFKFSTVAIAASLGFGAAQAATLELFSVTPANGGSSIVFGAVNNTGNPVSFVADLNLNMGDFDINPTEPCSAPGCPSAPLFPNQKWEWNFVNNTFTKNGVVQSGTYAYSTQYASFVTAVGNATGTRYGVFAGSSTGSGRYLSTGNATAAQLAGQTGGNSAQLSLTSGLLTNNNNKGTIVAGNTAGANTVVGSTASSTGYLLGSTNLGTGGNWQGRLNFSALVNAGSDSRFYQLTANQAGGIDLGSIYAGDNGKWNFTNGVLTWTTPVPEASTTAMLLAGLAAVGFMSRRRFGA